MAKRLTYLRGSHAIAKNAFAGSGAARRKKRQTIVAARVTTYPDSGQTKVWIEWGDGSSTSGPPDSVHMQQLINRAKREGVRVKHGLFGSER